MGDWLASIDWSVVLDYVLKIVGIALGTAITTFGSILFGKLQAKLGETRLNTFIDRCVRAAEQLFPNLGKKTGEEKYEYVFNLVKEKYPKISDERLKALIEGAVYGVSEEVKQIAKEKEKEIPNAASILKVE